VTNQNDTNVAYQAGQQDSDAWRLLAEIVHLDLLCDGSGEYEDFHNLNQAINRARAALEARK
jgi:hypothetical protein